jgi:hypothetical protein
MSSVSLRSGDVDADHELGHRDREQGVAEGERAGELVAAALEAAAPPGGGARLGSVHGLRTYSRRSSKKARSNAADSSASSPESTRGR